MEQKPIDITVSGPQASGKTILIQSISAMLSAKGIKHHVYGDAHVIRVEPVEFQKGVKS